MAARVDTNVSKELTTDQVTVAATATLIVDVNPNRKFLEIFNTDDTVNVYVGGSAVTTSDGHAIGPGTRLTLSGAITTAAIYGIVAADTEVVSYLEF